MSTSIDTPTYGDIITLCAHQVLLCFHPFRFVTHSSSRGSLYIICEFKHVVCLRRPVCGEREYMKSITVVIVSMRRSLFSTFKNILITSELIRTVWVACEDSRDLRVRVSRPTGSEHDFQRMAGSVVNDLISTHYPYHQISWLLGVLLLLFNVKRNVTSMDIHMKRFCKSKKFMILHFFSTSIRTHCEKCLSSRIVCSKSWVPSLRGFLDPGCRVRQFKNHMVGVTRSM